jgi:hypothetical protein
MAGWRQGRAGISCGFGAREPRARVCQVRGVGSRVTAEVVAVGRLASWRRKRKKRERRVGEGREDFTSLDGWKAWLGLAGSAQRARGVGDGGPLFCRRATQLLSSLFGGGDRAGK